MIYFDSAATTPVTQPVLDAMIPYLTESFGNPSTLYKLGREAKAAIDKAREQFADAINADPEQILFTSGATESNNLIRRNYNTISSAYEHPSMKTDIQVNNVNEMKVWFGKSGRYGIDDLVACWQYVNSETGVIFPIKEYAELAHSYGYKFHSDCTSAFGKVDVDVKDLDVDFASFSGHKFHAPKGVGVLYVKDPKHFKTDIVGGGQERGVKSGTENVASIVGLGKAAELYKYNKNNKANRAKYFGLETARFDLICEIIRKFPVQILSSKTIPNTTFGNVPNIICMAVNDVIGENVMLALSSEEIYVSTGTACHSGSNTITPMIKMFDIPDKRIRGIIRVSFDEVPTEETIKHFADRFCYYCKSMSKPEGV